MKKHLKKHKSFIGYFAAAGTGVIVQYIVGTIICIRYLKTPYQTGISIGYLAAIPVGFILSKNIAFSSKNSGKTYREILKFIVVLFFSYLITVKGSYFSLKLLQKIFGNFEITVPFIQYRFNPIGTASHFAGMGLSFIFNYFTHKWFTFNDTGLMKKVRNMKY